MPVVLSYLCLIRAHRVDRVTTASELPITIFELQLAELLIYHQAALSFQISDKRRYLILGGISSNIMDMVGTTFHFYYAHALPLT